MKLNTEEKKYLEENKALYKFIKSRGWSICRAKLMSQIDDLQSVMNVDGTDANEVLIDIKVRKLVIKELLNWLDSVEGQANQFEGNTVSSSERVDSFIYQEEEDF